MSIVGATLLGLWIYFTENVADRLGLDEFAKSGGQALLDSSYVEWISWSALFISGAAVALWIDYLLRPAPRTIEPVTNVTEFFQDRYYMNEEVLLDGCSYENCTFKSVKLVYNGGVFHFVGNTIEAPISFRTESQEAQSILKFLTDLGIIQVPVIDEHGPMDFDGFDKSQFEPLSPQSAQETETKKKR